MGVVKYSGPVASFHCPTEATIRSLKVHFSPKQLGEGTPSPENVREISGWSGVEVYQTGKNLFDYRNAQIVNKKNRNTEGVEVKDVTGSYTSTAFPVAPSSDITISKIVTAQSNAYYLLDKDKGWLSKSDYWQNVNTPHKTVNVPANAFYIQLQSGDLSRVDWSSVQIEYGSVPTDYEAYRGQTYTVDWSENDTIYGGYVDLITGELVQEWTEPLALTAPYYYGGNVCFGYIYPDKYTAYPTNDSSSRVMSTFKSSEFDINTRNCFIFGGHAKFEKTDGNGNLNPEWTEWYESLEEKPTVSLKLYEPVHYQLSPTQLSTLIGRNNIWSNADYIEVEYDLHETQSILARKQFIIANQPHVEKLAAAPLQNFVTDMAAPLKKCEVYFGPKQDLHGYEKPWVGGAGKNLLKISSDNRIGVMDNATETDTGFNISNDNVNGGYLVKVKPNTTYTYSYISTYNGGSMHGRIWTFSEKPDSSTWTSTGSLLINKTSWTGSASFTTDENTNWVVAGAYAYGNGLNSSLTNMQVEEGSIATSYEPYENICPIEGWSGIEVNETKKSLVEFKVEQREASDYYNGYNGWVDEIPANHFPTQTQLVYSVYLNCVNSTNEYERRAKIWIYQKQGTYRYAIGNQIDVGNSGVSVATVTVQDTDSIIGFGLGMGKGTIASQPMVEFGSTATEYEPCNGTTIPITFPWLGKNYYNATSITKTQADVTWTANDDYSISVSGTPTGYSMITTGTCEIPSNGKICLSANFNELTNVAWDNYYIYNSSMELLESTGGGGTGYKVIDLDTYTDPKYIKLSFKRGNNNIEMIGTIKPMIEIGTQPTSYEPYNIIYEGYVDLAKGKIIQTHKSIIFDGSESGWDTYKTSDQIHFHRVIEDKKVGIGTSISSIFPNVKNTYFWDRKLYSQYGDHNSLNRIYVNAPYEMPNGVSEWREWLSNNPMQLVYELATPIEYALTPTTLKTLRGTNNIWSNSNGPVEIKYWTH